MQGQSGGRHRGIEGQRMARRQTAHGEILLSRPERGHEHEHQGRQKAFRRCILDHDRIIGDRGRP